MRYGISSGSLVVDDDRLLLVHHFERGKYDFWLPPGGSLEGEETIFDCAKRETFEETGLRVYLGEIIYIQEFAEPGYHFCKFFILSSGFEGEITLKHRELHEGFLIDARFFSQEQVRELPVLPEILKRQFWNELKSGFSKTHYLGLEKIEGK